MFKPGRFRASAAVSPISPISPRWFDNEDNDIDGPCYFSSEPEEISESDYSNEKSTFVPILIPEPKPRDRRWLGDLRITTTELRSVLAAKNIGTPVERLGLCLRPLEDADEDIVEAACDEFVALSELPAQARLCWSDDGWFRETSALIHRLLVLLAQKRIGMTVNSFLDFVSINNSSKATFDKVLSGHLDKIRNRLLCKRDSPDLIPYDVFLGKVPLGVSVE